MKPKYTYAIRPRLPENLKFLQELAGNVWWDWNYDAVDLFRRISRHQWTDGKGNPIHVLVNVEQERINYLSREEGFLAHMERVKQKFNRYMQEPRWFQRAYPERQDVKVAYFSAEYGLTNCLRVYSGGLGMLAGDHLKTASDMGFPLVGMGLAYRLGYFQQYLNIDGWQQERYTDNDFYNLPATRVLDKDGNWLTFEIPYVGKHVKAALWRVDVGRVPLYLITTNLRENPPEVRAITDQLYGGGHEMRVKQEIVLGIGGTIALKALGINPTVYHLNEGHSAFLSLERIKQFMREDSLDFGAAFEASYCSSCFTTHTPVPAGNDVFSEDLVRKYLEPLSRDLVISWDKFMEFGRGHEMDDPNAYCMTVTAIKNAWHSNGVSRLHAQVSRNMWKSIWPKLPENEVPITPITNGVHIYSWISHDMGELFDRYLGPRWRDDPLESELWHRIYEIPDEELWRTHERRRARLVAFARARLERDLASRGASQETIADASEVLNPEALIIGFARRFATYKRAALLFRDMDRLHKLTANREQPVQFIFAGKAHPRDDEGKKLIRQIIHAVREEPLRFRFIFLEDYNINVARYLVQGCDIWLNTPRRPLEASGTSGMKAVANGGLHLSVPDGWWAQAYHADYGWAIGRGEDYDDYEYQDSVECDALYDILEKEVTPMFYKRSVSGIPREWVSMMKRSMSNLIPRFSSHRMVWNYIDQAYIPADDSQRMLAADNYDRARALAGWRVKVEENWDGVRVEDIAVDQHEEIQVGDRIKLKARINLGGLAPEDVRVEAYSGPVDSRGNFQQALGVEMQRDEGGKGAQHEYLATLVAPQSGHFGFTVRLFPRNQDLQNRFAMYRVTWADNG